jgi:hypothetical protein
MRHHFLLTFVPTGVIRTEPARSADGHLPARAFFLDAVPSGR